MTADHDSNQRINNNSRRKNILVVGATGGTGRELMTRLLAHSSTPHIHAFCRTKPNPNCDWVQACTSIQMGDAKNANDLANALTETKASTVIVSIGAGESVKKTDIRTATSQALVRAIEQTPGLSNNIQIVLVSSIGSGPSKIKLGMGIGKLVEYHLRYILEDHTGQESALLNHTDLAGRTWVVRATALTDKKGSGRVVEFGDREKCPTGQIARGDVASYIVEKLCDGSGGHVSGVVNIDTSNRKQ